MMIKKTKKQEYEWEQTWNLFVIYLCVCWLGWGAAADFVLLQMSWSGEHPDEGRTCRSGAENTDQTHLNTSTPCTDERYPCVCVCECFTCGRPVRMVERLGEQLLTEVKALLNTRLRWARERRWGVWTTELLYTSVSKPASSAGGGETDTFISSYTTYS